MSRPAIEILREISNIHQNIMEFQQKMEEEQNRLKGIQDQRAEKQEQIEELKSELKDLTSHHNKAENDLTRIETNLERAEKAYKNAHSEAEATASSKQIETLKPKKEELTERILNYIEEIETKEREIKETDEFLIGSEQTLNEIQAEVDANVQEIRNEIEAREDEIKNEYIPALPKEMRTDVTSVREKMYNKKPFSLIQGRSCRKCGQTVDSMQFSSLERGESVELCAGCNRILIPPS